MSKAPSVETQLRTAKRDLRYLRKEHQALRDTINTYRTRATHGEQAAAEWKQRFDALLKIVGPSAAERSEPK